MNDTTGTPLPDGLFCERIFGPVKDWECSCKSTIKLQKKAFKRNSVYICENCGVQVTESKIRSYRMG